MLETLHLRRRYLPSLESASTRHRASATINIRKTHTPNDMINLGYRYLYTR